MARGAHDDASIRPVDSSDEWRRKFRLTGQVGRSGLAQSEGEDGSHDRCGLRIVHAFFGVE